MQRNGRRPGKLLVGMLCLLLIIIGGSLFFIVRSANNSGKTALAHNTPITATPQQPAATSTPIGHNPLFSDFFFDNSKNWALTDVKGYMRTIENGRLILSDTNHKPLVETLPPISYGTSVNNFTDFSIITTVTLTHADSNDSVGLYLRGDSNLDRDYRITLRGDTTYMISKESLDEARQAKTTILVAPTSTPLLRPIGQQNTLTAIMKGSVLVLKLNGSILTSISDTDYTHGQIALFVDNGSTSSGVTAAFNSVEIYPAPDELPAYESSLRLTERATGHTRNVAHEKSNPDGC